MLGRIRILNEQPEGIQCEALGTTVEMWMTSLPVCFAFFRDYCSVVADSWSEVYWGLAAAVISKIVPLIGWNGTETT